MKAEDWENGGWMRTLGMLLPGFAAEIRDDQGRMGKDDDFLILLNAHHEPVEFHLPKQHCDGRWKLVFDTANRKRWSGTKMIKMEGRSFVLLGRPQTSSRDLVPNNHPI
jgi:glycogen operon protein